MAVIGIDLGGTKLSGAIFTEEGRILKTENFLLEKRKGKEVSSLILNLIQKLIEYTDSEKISVSSIGCGIPGAVNQEKGTVWAPNIPEWFEYPLKNEIDEFLNERKISVRIDSDRACSILGEVWQGAAKGCKNAIFLAVGTGIGAGILADGRILHGSNDIAGAVGWFALHKPFLEKYRSCGFFEYYGSGEGLAKVAKEYLMNNKNYKGKLSFETITAHHLFDALKINDPVAKRVIDEAVEYWGMAAANLVSIFNPEKIIFGGGIFGPGIALLERIFAEAEKWAQPLSIRQVKFVGSVLGNDAAMYGAARLAKMD